MKMKDHAAVACCFSVKGDCQFGNPHTKREREREASHHFSSLHPKTRASRTKLCDLTLYFKAPTHRAKHQSEMKFKVTDDEDLLRFVTTLCFSKHQTALSKSTGSFFLFDNMPTLIDDVAC